MPLQLFGSVTVNTTADENDGDTSSVAALVATPGGTGISLREAITAINNDAGETTILFDGVVFPAGTPATITVTGSRLPEVSGVGTVIDGVGAGVIVDGTGAGNIDGFYVRAKGFTIRNLQIQNFNRDGIDLNSPGYGTIEKNTIVLNQRGVRCRTNSASVTTIRENLFGTNAARASLPNTVSGLRLQNGVNVTVGGTNAADANIFAFQIGNGDSGIRVATGGATILGNYFGTDAAGANLGNYYGIRMDAASAGVVIGSPAVGAANTFGFNSRDHIFIQSTGAGNVIQGNYIGTNASWANLGGGRHGIFLQAANTGNPVQVGGTSAGEGNWICFQTAGGSYGMRIDNGEATIQGNYFGTNSSGTDLGNRYALQFQSGADSAVVGGTAAGAGNVFGHSNNMNIGIQSDADATITFQGNFIGTDDQGRDLGPGAHNIDIADIGVGGTTVVQIGGTTGAAANTIGFATGPDRAAINISSLVGPTIQGNYIGTDASARDLGNRNGIRGSGSTANLVIGAADPSVDNTAANVIAHNTEYGIVLFGASVDNNTFRGNSLHSNGTSAIFLTTSANENVATPTLSAVTGTLVSGSGAAAGATIDVYSNPSGQSQARTWIGSGAADGSGNFGLFIPAVSVGDEITVSQTDASGNTSMLSSAVTAIVASSAVVDTTADENDGDTSSVAALIATPGGTGISLREAITAVVNDGSVNTVEFDVATFPVGTPATISVAGSALPAISVANMVLDASGRGVVLDGSALSSGENGLQATGTNVLIRNIEVRSFPGAGIAVTGTGSGTVRDNTLVLNQDGILVTTTSSSPTEIIGNFVGTNVTYGSLGNTRSGIRLDGAVNVNVGGTSSGDANVVGYHDGTGDVGVHVVSGQARIVGNLIGTNSTNGDIGNAIGVLVDTGATAVTLGESGGGNTVGFSSDVSVRLRPTAGSHSVKGNYIGTGSTFADLGPDGHNVEVLNLGGTASVTIGGAAAGEFNVIAFADDSGKSGLYYEGSVSPVVERNFIGTNAVAAILGNDIGILADMTATGLVIGETDPATDNTGANVIAHNGSYGIRLEGTGVDTVSFRGNEIFSNGTMGVGLISSANNSIATPTITSVVGVTVTGTGAEANATIDIYTDSTGQGQARVWRGSGTADGSGNFSITAAGITVGTPVTVIQTSASRSSGISTAVAAAPATITVNTTADEYDGNVSSADALQMTPGGTGISLREAIAAINNDSVATVILFDGTAFPAGTPGTISVTGTALPDVTGDGTQIDATGRGVIVDGTALGSGDGLRVAATDVLLDGITVANFPADGIVFTATAQGTIQNCVITGCQDGIYLNTSHANQTLVRSNHIGTDTTFADLGNTANGVLCVGTVNVVIGGDLSADANVIAWQDGNGDAGVRINSGSVEIYGNYIGTNSSGATLPNRQGIYVNTNATGAVPVGASTLNRGNVIGGNTQYDYYNRAQAGTHTVRGNWFGTDSSERDLGSAGRGIYVHAANQGAPVTIGGTAAGEGNTFGFYGVQAIRIRNGEANIYGNHFGTNAAGANLANATTILIDDESDTVNVGGSAAGAGNVFGHSTSHHVNVQTDGGAVTVQGNYFGTDSSWRTFGSGAHHIQVTSLGTGANLQIGGTTAGTANIFAFATGTDRAALNLSSTGSVVFEGNYVGTNSAGANLGNSFGIRLSGSASGVRIGAADPTMGNTAANIFAFQTGDAIYVNGASANTFRGNSLHSNSGSAINILGGGNGGIAAPTLTSMVGALVSGSGAQAGAVIDVYSNPSPETQARIWRGAGTADGSGNFSFAVVGVDVGDNVVVTQTDGSGNTSILSNVVAKTAGAVSEIVVDTTADEYDGDVTSASALVNTPGGTGISLREAIIAVNNDLSVTDIRFDATLFPSGTPATIQTATELPVVTGAGTIIDASGRGVILDGSIQGSGDGIRISAAGAELRGLTIDAYPDNGVHLYYPGYGLVEDNVLTRNTRGLTVSTTSDQTTTIRANLIGTNAARADLGNSRDGIWCTTCDNVVVGGAGPSDGNIIGFSDDIGSAGIRLWFADVDIRNNFIGTDSSGTDLGNWYGIALTSLQDRDCRIGGNGLGNVIGFSTAPQIINNAKSGLVTIQGNYVGTDSSWRDLGGDDHGIQVSAPDNVTATIIGGSGSGEGNHVGFQDTPFKVGIRVWSGNATIRGNFIGTNAAGADLGNYTGFTTESQSGTVIFGGQSAGEPNVVGHSVSRSARLTSASGSIQVTGNYFGTDSSWRDLGPDAHNVEITALGGGASLTFEANHVCFADEVGRAGLVHSGSVAAAIHGNYIGTNASSADLGNHYGILLEAASTNLVIGAADPATDNSDANIIARNDGRAIFGTGSGIDSVSFRGNSIWLNGDGIILDDGANAGLAAPVITSAVGATVSGTGALSGAVIDVYTNPGDEDQARTWLGSGTADVNGNFSLTLPALNDGERVTVTQTTSGRTSGLSVGRLVTDQMITQIVVDTTTDELDGDVRTALDITLLPGGTGVSLREALLTANNDPSVSEIVFDAGVFPSGAPATISLSLGNLPEITGDNTSIDATGRGVILDGDALGSGDGLVFKCSNFHLDNVRIRRFPVYGVNISNPAHGTVENCTLVENKFGGLFVGTQSGSPTTIRSNYIGTDSTFANLGNTWAGIQTGTLGNVTIGGDLGSDANIIGFHDLTNARGVFIAGSGGTITGNYVGTNASGADLGNYHGVEIWSGATGSTIGGSGAGNVIGHSIRAQVVNKSNSGSHVLIGNYIGTNPSWENLGGPLHGVEVRSVNPSAFVIGGAGAGEGNWIAFAGAHGVSVFDGDVTVLGNLFGTNASGADLGNSISMFLGAGADDATIGDGTAGGANVFGHSVRNLSISASGSVSVRGNYFGTNSAWQDLGPDADSIIVSNAGPSAVISIGGSGAGDGNWICFADNPGRSAIQIEGTNLPTIEGNFIGTNVSAADLGNFNGIYSVWTAQDARIGATNPAVDNSAANTIAFNDGWGIQFSGPGVDDIRFRGNLIHTNGLGAVSLDAGANAGLTAPDLLTVAATVVAGTGAEPGAAIDIYSNPLGEFQARSYRASGSADGSGNFSITVPGLETDLMITVMQTTSSSTSMLSNAVRSTNATITEVIVDTTSDELDGDTASVAALIATPGGTGVSLREAITAVNNDPGVDVVNFDAGAFPAGTPGVINVTMGSLPTLAGPGGTIDAAGRGVIVDGTAVGGDGIKVTAANFLVRNLTIRNFGVYGVDIADPAWGTLEDCTLVLNGFGGLYVHTMSSNLTTVRANYIGTDAAFTDLGNTWAGVQMGHCGNVVVGGALGSDANVIAFHDLMNARGVFFAGSGGKVVGNYIGTNGSGADLANYHGVEIWSGASGSQFGESGNGNVVGFSQRAHVLNKSNTGTHVLQGNYLGTDPSWRDLGGPLHGIEVQTPNPTSFEIGGSGAGEGNWIAFANNGVRVVNGSVAIKGNHFGTNAAGADLGNQKSVSLESGADDAAIGDGTAGGANVFGHSVRNLSISASGTVTVRGNYFGTNSSWQDLGPDADSIIISNAGPASDVTIGGTGAGDGNWICFADSPTRAGIQIEGTTLPVVEGNYIGTNASNADLGNARGIYANWTSTNMRIGAADPAISNLGANTIAHNNEWGVTLQNGGVSGIAMRGNSIHSNGLGAIELFNGANGGLAAPVISDVVDGIVTGTGATAGAAVDVYRNPTGTSEARTWAAATVADGSGNFSVYVATIQADDDITVIQTASGSSSGVSAAVAAGEAASSGGEEGMPHPSTINDPHTPDIEDLETGTGPLPSLAAGVAANSFENGIGTQSPVADGVQVHSGQFVRDVLLLQRQSRGFDFEIRAVHRSFDGRTSVLGHRWHLSLEEKLVADGADWIWHAPNGRIERFVPDPLNAGLHICLQTDSVVDASSGLELRTPDGVVRAYDGAEGGRIVSVTDRLGNVQTWAYDGAGRVSTVTDTRGVVTTLTYDVNGYLENIRENTPLEGAGTDHREVDVDVNVDGELVSLHPEHLESAVSPAGEQYVVDAQDRILEVKDEAGTELFSNAYDGAGRVTRQSTGSAANNFAYSATHSVRDDNQLALFWTSHNDHSGGVTEYWVNGLGNVIESTVYVNAAADDDAPSEPGSNWPAPEGPGGPWLASTDRNQWSGGSRSPGRLKRQRNSTDDTVWSYSWTDPAANPAGDRQAEGRLVSRSVTPVATGIPAVTTWTHVAAQAGAHRLVDVETAPDGGTADHAYDAHGRILSIVVTPAAGPVETTTRTWHPAGNGTVNNNGLMDTETAPSGVVSTNTIGSVDHEAGRVTRVDRTDGTWTQSSWNLAGITGTVNGP